MAKNNKDVKKDNEIKKTVGVDKPKSKKTVQKVEKNNKKVENKKITNDVTISNNNEKLVQISTENNVDTNIKTETTIEKSQEEINGVEKDTNAIEVESSNNKDLVETTKEKIDTNVEENKPESKEEKNNSQINQKKEVNNKKTSKSSTKKMIILIIIMLVFWFIVGLVAIYFIFFNYTTYTLDEILEFNVNGYNEYATIEYEIKEEYEENDLELLLESSDIYFSKSSGIENGDTITVTIYMDKQVSKDLKIKIDETYEFEVSGLEEVTVLDLFKDLDITYTNKSPYLKLSVSNSGIDTAKYGISYKIETMDTNKSSYDIKSGWFYNGEKIKITAKYDKDKALKDGYIVLEEEKETVVEKQDSFFTKKEEFTSEFKDFLNKAMIQEVKNYATPEVMKRIYCNYYYCSNYAGASNRVEDYKLSKEPELYFMYLGLKTGVQKDTVYDDLIHTAIIASYKLSFVGDDSNKISGGKGHVYCNVHFDNIYITKEGKLSDYSKEEYFIRCSSSVPKESAIKNSDVTGKYQYDKLIKID